MPQGFHSSMYAISESSSIYHLLYSDKNYTLCGFRAEKHHLPAKGGLLVVEIVPPHRELCKQCDKMKKRRKAVTENQAHQNHNPEDSFIKESPRPEHAVFQVFIQ